MRIRGIIFIAAVMLAGCVHWGIKKNIEALEQIKPGDTQTSVFKAMGPPDFRNDITDQRLVAFYQTTAGQTNDAPVTPALCTPIAFENGSVVSIGKDLTERWTREEEERIRQAELAERRRQKAEAAASARQRAERERLKKIEALEKEVKPIPVSKPALNLKLYRQLLDLDPNNPRYRKKVDFYTQQLANKKKVSKKTATRKAKANRRQAWEGARDSRNKSLREYTGNGTAEMAVHDMGSGSLYIWVKNVSEQIITTHPDYFTLVDIENNKARCDISSSLDTVLEPGSIAHGKIEYSQEIEIKELIFQNRESGRISKSFQ